MTDNERFITGVGGELMAMRWSVKATNARGLEDFEATCDTSGAITVELLASASRMKKGELARVDVIDFETRTHYAVILPHQAENLARKLGSA